MATANRIATILKGLKFPVEAVEEPDQDQDGDIKINDRFHVQVGYDYAILVEALPDGCFRFGTTYYHKDLPKLLLDLHKALWPTKAPSLIV